MSKEYKPGPPPKGAIEFFRAKGWKVGFDYQDVWAEEHSGAFTVAKAVTVDVLETVRGAVDKALAEGQTFAQFKNELAPTLQKLGWWGIKEQLDPKTGEVEEVQLGSPRRLKVIYQTNMRMARAAGRWQAIERTKRMMPYLRYELGPAGTHREQHIAWAGTVLHADDPWWDEHYPPNGWNCKCWVQQLSKENAEESGISESPRVKRVAWVNPRTGKTDRVPEGVTPGFSYHAGKTRLNEQLNWFSDKLGGAEPTAAQAVHRTWLQPNLIEQWRRDPRGNLPVAVLDEDTQTLLKSQQRTVLMSDWTMNKQDGKKPPQANGEPARSAGHPELTADEYCLIPEVINRGRMIQVAEKKMVFIQQSGVHYEAVVQTARDGKDNWLDSFHRCDPRQAERELKKKGARELRPENGHGNMPGPPRNP